MDRPLRPEIVVSSFSEKDVHAYIARLTEIQQAFGPEQLIVVHIDSYGGSAYGLIMLYEHLKMMGNPIATFTSSKAMSAGSFTLAMAGSPGLRFASPNATILVHEVQAGAMGDIKDMEQQMGSIQALNERILTLFAKAIGLNKASDVRDLIKARSVGHDLTLTAQEAKELGIIDCVGYIKLQPLMRYDLVVATAEKAKPTLKAKAKKPAPKRAKAKKSK